MPHSTPTSKSTFFKGLIKRFLYSDKRSIMDKTEALFDGASTGLRMRGWSVTDTGPNVALFNGLGTIRSRSRDLTRKFPLMNGAYDTIASNIVGTGIQAISKAENPIHRKMIKEAWENWCEVCDVEEMHSFAAILDTAVRQRYEAGEVFIRHRPLPANSEHEIPYQIQILESEHCPIEKTIYWLTATPYKGGIEIDKFGRRVAYHMYPFHPGEKLRSYANLKTIRIPANEIMHYFKPLRPGQIRSIPEYFPAQVNVRNFRIYQDAELMGKQLGSMPVGMVTSPATG